MSQQGTQRAGARDFYVLCNKIFIHALRTQAIVR